jgi:hypothetical protein
MESDNSREQEQDVEDFIMSDEDAIFASDDLPEDDEDSYEDLVESLSQAVEETTPVYESAEVPDRVLETVNAAQDGWTVKVRSDEDYLAVLELLEESNPKGLKVVHKPNLGHHSMASL